MFTIDQRSRVPIYEQIINNIKESILLGVLSPGEKLPSVRELAKIMTINPNTIQKAYKELERQGVIEILRSKGTFVREDYLANMNKEKVNKLKDIFKKGVIEAKYLGLSESEILNIVKNLIKDFEGSDK